MTEQWKTAVLASAAILGSAAMVTGAAAVAQPARSAVAELRSADGKPAGRAVATERRGGIEVALTVTGLPAGIHGAHVHTVGRCDAPDFTTAGAHWNPTGKQHGTQNPQGPHAGDLPNLTVGSNGRGTLTMRLPAGTMAGLLDADGAAFVVHANPDDLHSDPSGNSGGRIACGVFKRG